MIPQIVKPFLWSYDVNSLDLIRDKRRIITNVLNFGTKDATDWLFKTYKNEDIKDCLISPLPGEWSNKSLNYWSLLMDIKPNQDNKRILK